MLKHLIIRIPGSAVIDIPHTRRLLEGSSIFTDIGPPDVVERAGAEKMHTYNSPTRLFDILMKLEISTHLHHY